MFDQFTQLVSDASGWAYAIVFVLALLDALVPVVPSESSVITAGVVAANGDLSVMFVVLAAAAGAFVGDNTAYFLGRRFGSRIEARFFSGERGRKQIQWAERQIAERGSELIVIGRFIPGGRTAVTLSAGTLRYPWRRFVLFDATAALVWALYATLLGYFGGRAFEDAPWKGLLLALAIAFAVAGGIELTRWALKRRRRRSVDDGGCDNEPEAIIESEPKGAEMSEPLTESEIELLRKGAMGAGLLVSVSDRGFFDSIKEAGTLAKHVATARGDSQSEVVRHVAEGRGVGFGVTSSPSEIESGTLDALRSGVTLLQQKAPDELPAYREFVLDLARSVAAAAPGGDQAEAATVAKIETALGAS